MKAQVMGGKKVGAKYMEVYADKLKKLIGFEPYPGTLNLKVESVPPLEKDEIPAFGKFGALHLAPCAVNYERAWAVFPERTTHPENIVEVIAEKNLKETLGLKVGDFVHLQF